MKTRIDFVTNSSSSSFVVIKKNDVSDKDIDSFVSSNSNQLIELAKEYKISVERLSDDIKDFIKNFKGEEIGNVQVQVFYEFDWSETPENYLAVLKNMPDWLKVREC